MTSLISRFRVALVLLTALLSSPAAAYKPLCKDSAGRTIQCAGTLDNTQAPTAIGAGTITGTVGVSQGGTGKNTWTVGSIPVASGVATLAEIAPGASGQVLTSNGAGAAPSMQGPTTATTAAATAGASHSLTTNAYEAIPSLSVSLNAGTYLCSANVRSTAQCSAGTGYLTLKLRNNTAASDVADSERLGALCSTTGQAFTATTPITELVTVGSTSVVQVYAVSPAGATYTARQVLSDADGRSRLVCVKTAP